LRRGTYPRGNAYHDRTKHHSVRYANGPGGLAWANQPDPSRRFSGAPVLRLPLAGRSPTDTFGLNFVISLGKWVVFHLTNNLTYT
jgi:hypothetical protein